MAAGSEEFTMTSSAKGTDIDQDLLLARALQEQERAWNALVSTSVPSSLQASSYYGGAASAGSDLDDEELARRLQSEEDQQSLYHQMQGLEGLGFEFDEGGELDYDCLGYEDLNAIGDVAGKVSKGLQPDAISKLPLLQVEQLRQQCCSTSGSPLPPQQQQQMQQQLSEQQQLAQKAYAASSMCTICQADYGEEEMVKLLPCGHLYHQECVDQWLGLNKTCPICNKEVTCSQAPAAADAAADATANATPAAVGVATAL